MKVEERTFGTPCRIYKVYNINQIVPVLSVVSPFVIIKI